MHEEVTVSQFAADCKSGTHASLRKGDVLIVYDLLYAMMLPSGNDAAIALAEHFGVCFPPREDGTEQDADGYFTCENPAEETYKSEFAHDSYMARFLAQMHRVARSLGANDSFFTNPHGMQGDGMYSCAHDILLLTREALKYPLFADIVRTRQSTVVIEGRFSRRVTYTNTNSLLDSATWWYSGVKTGWIPDAHGQKIHGNLVSQVEESGKKLIVVVIGCLNKELRFVETEILVSWTFRWLESLLYRSYEN